MRWFFLLLLICNAAFFYWRQGEVPHAYDGVGRDLLAEGERLEMLSETGEARVDLASPSANVDGDDVPPPAAPVTDSAVACWARGPYRKLDEARALADEHELLVLKYERIEANAEFWVHLGPFPSFAAANQQHLQLQGKRIDSFVIRSGDLENAVSLGLFSDESRAKVQAERMVAKGYQAKVRRLAKQTYRYWVGLSGNPDEPSLEEARRRLFNKKNTDPQAEKKSCNLVASWNDFD